MMPEESLATPFQPVNTQIPADTSHIISHTIGRTGR